MSYSDMKNFCPVRFIDIKYQVDHKTPQNIQLFEEYRGAVNEARSFTFLIRHKETKRISDGSEITTVEVI